MADILDSAQAQINNAAQQVGGPPDPANVDLGELDLPYSSHAHQNNNNQSTISNDSVVPTETPPMPKSPRPTGAAVSTLLFLFVTLPLSVYFISQQRALTDQRSKAAYVTKTSELYVANLNKTSFSVIWKEEIPAKGCAVAKNIKTQKETRACDDILSRMHLVTLTNLDPYYSYAVAGQGGGKIKLHPFFGNSIISGLFDKTKPPSRIVQGTINQANGQPLKDAFVIVSPFLTDRFYFPVASYTDQNGTYAIDTSLIDAQNPKPYELIIVEVVNRQGQTLIEQKIPSPSGNQIATITLLQ
ncbi:MAG: hypothetical protein AAB557_04750 [Patescibacteria group bacterium]|mgnify:CR=1 FL=1